MTNKEILLSMLIDGFLTVGMLIAIRIEYKAQLLNICKN